MITNSCLECRDPATIPAYDVDDEMIGYLCQDCQADEEEASGEYVEFDDDQEGY